MFRHTATNEYICMIFGSPLVLLFYAPTIFTICREAKSKAMHARVTLFQ